MTTEIYPYYRAKGLKFDKAREWKIPVVNANWLQDILLGDLSPLKLPVNQKFLTLVDEPLKLDLFKVARLMGEWVTSSIYLTHCLACSATRLHSQVRSIHLYHC